MTQCHAVFLPPDSLALPSGPDRTDFGHPRLQNRKRAGDRNPLLIPHGSTRRQLDDHLLAVTAEASTLMAALDLAIEEQLRHSCYQSSHMQLTGWTDHTKLHLSLHDNKLINHGRRNIFCPGSARWSGATRQGRHVHPVLATHIPAASHPLSPTSTVGRPRNRKNVWYSVARVDISSHTDLARCTYCSPVGML